MSVSGIFLARLLGVLAAPVVWWAGRWMARRVPTQRVPRCVFALVVASVVGTGLFGAPPLGLMVGLLVVDAAALLVVARRG